MHYPWLIIMFIHPITTLLCCKVKCYQQFKSSVLNGFKPTEIHNSQMLKLDGC